MSGAGAVNDCKYLWKTKPEFDEYARPCTRRFNLSFTVWNLAAAPATGKRDQKDFLSKHFRISFRTSCGWNLGDSGVAVRFALQSTICNGKLTSPSSFCNTWSVRL